MSKYKTIDVWNRVFGTKQEAYDYTGRLMKKSACGNRDRFKFCVNSKN